MERLTRNDLEALLDFLRKGYSRLNLEDFRKHILLDLPKLVSSDITTYNEVNLRKQCMVWSREPAEARFPGDEDIFEQHIHEHPLIVHYANKKRDARVLKISDFLTTRQFHRLGLYNEFFRRLGVEHQIAVPLPAPSLLATIGIALNRGLPDFTERDRLILSLLRPHLIQAYRNAKAVTRMEQELTVARQVLDKTQLGVIVLGRDGGVSLVNAQAKRLVEEYFGTRSLKGNRLPEILASYVREEETRYAQTTPPVEAS